VERLRQKRCHRLKIKHSSNHAGEARVFATFDRAVKRHPGSVLLWREQLAYAAGVRATKKWRRVMTAALRMHPGDARLWAMAGRKAAGDGDMDRARGVFLRGCRFCTGDGTLWLEYARCEMEWLARVAAKGPKALVVAAAAEDDADYIRCEDEGDEDDLDFGDAARIPGSGEGNAGVKFDGEEALEKGKHSPAMDGAIPRAIFDVARKQPFYSPSTAEAFFDVFAEFTSVPAQPGIVAHVVASMGETHPDDPSTASCRVRQSLVGVDPSSPQFPSALREALARLRSATEVTADQTALAAKTVAWIEPLLAVEDLDSGLRTVLEHTKRKLAGP